MLLALRSRQSLTDFHAEGQQYGLLCVASALLLGRLNGSLLHLLTTVVEDGLKAVAISQQESVVLSCRHVPRTNPL